MSHKTKTIVCRVSDYYPYSGLNGYCFIREYRHWIVGLMHYVHLGIRQPTWQIKDEIYTLGFIPPHFPVPATADTAILSLWCQPEITVWTVYFFKKKLLEPLKERFYA